MFLTTTNPVGQFTSPFGAHIAIAAGMITELAVERAYWLVGHPDIVTTFASPEEEAECERLVALSKFNPLKEIPTPQSLTPNATLQLDGASTRYPVIVVNPQGLMSEYQGTYEFGKPPVNLVFDKAMIRQVVEEFHAAMNEGRYDDLMGDDEPTEGDAPMLPSEVAPPVEVTEPQVTPVDGETKSTEEAPPVGGVSSETVTPNADTGVSESPGVSKGRGRKTISDEDI